MADLLELACPHCERPLRVPPSHAGKTGICPGCNKPVPVPDPNAPPPPEEPEAPRAPDDDRKECAFCGERIKKIAKKCLHCGEFVDGSGPSTRGRSPRVGSPRVEGEFKPCPFCQGKEAVSVGFTWWGGIIGPKMLTHVRCLDCERCFNGKTGASNDKGIAIYLTVGVALALGLCVLIGVVVANA